MVHINPYKPSTPLDVSTGGEFNSEVGVLDDEFRCEQCNFLKQSLKDSWARRYLPFTAAIILLAIVLLSLPSLTSVALLLLVVSWFAHRRFRLVAWKCPKCGEQNTR